MLDIPSKSPIRENFNENAPSARLFDPDNGKFDWTRPVRLPNIRHSAMPPAFMDINGGQHAFPKRPDSVAFEKTSDPNDRNVIMKVKRGDSQDWENHIVSYETALTVVQQNHALLNPHKASITFCQSLGLPGAKNAEMLDQIFGKKPEFNFGGYVAKKLGYDQVMYSGYSALGTKHSISLIKPDVLYLDFNKEPSEKFLERLKQGGVTFTGPTTEKDQNGLDRFSLEIVMNENLKAYVQEQIQPLPAAQAAPH